MHINWWTLALQTVNVLVLIWLLSRFLYRPVVAAIVARQAAADQLLAEAGAAKQQALADGAALKARNEAFASESETLRAEVLASTDADRVRLLDQAKHDAVRIGEKAKTAIAADRATMRKAMEAEAATLAGDMAEKLVARLPPARVQEAMVHSLIDCVAALPDAERATLIAGGAITITTPARIGEEDRAGYRDALTAVLTTPPEIAFSEDLALIGGCELRGRNVHIRNSWRADLDDMLGRLAKDGPDVGRP